MMYSKQKTIINIVLLPIIYVLGLILASFILNYDKENSARSVKLSDRKLPVLSVQTDNEHYYNFLNGYKNAMDIRYVHESLAVIGGKASNITLKITGYEDKNLRVDYELMDYERKTVYDRNEIGSSYIDGQNMFVKIPVKTVVLEDKELMLHMMLYQNHDNPIHYYIRLQQGYGRLIDNYITYINNFVNACINKDKKVAQYIEPKAEQDNSNFGLATIHSGFSTLTFDNMKPRLIYEPQIELCECDGDVAMFKCRYRLEIFEERKEKATELEVVERYRVRQGVDRVVLLNFERKIREIFSASDFNFGKNTLKLGITSDDFEYLCTNGGEKVFFKKNRKLWAYNNSSGNLTEISLWVDSNDLFGDVYDIKLLNIDEVGNVDFIIYGYIPSGEHEGMNGIILYRYDSELNSVIERIRINSDRGFSYIEDGMSRLAYLGADKKFYIEISDKLYRLDLSTEKLGSSIAKTIEVYEPKVSASKRYLAYTDFDKKDAVKTTVSGKLYIKDLMNGSVSEIAAEKEEFLLPLGFLGEDLIYGTYKRSDSGMDQFGKELLPAGEIKIISMDKELKKKYSAGKYYIKGIEISDSTIELYRVKKKMSKYYEVSNDRIIYSSPFVPSLIELKFEGSYDSAKRKQGVLVFPNRIVGGTHRVLKPILTVERDIGSIEIKNESDRELYYIFRYNQIIQSYDSLVTAINHAYDSVSSVVHREKGTIWQRTAYDESYLIDYDSIDERYYSIGRVDKVVKDLKNIQSLNGVSLNNVLYFVKHDIPILAHTKEKGKVLLVGYDNYNIIMREYNKKGTLSDEFYYGKKDSEELFNKNDNRFLYLK